MYMRERTCFSAKLHFFVLCIYSCEYCFGLVNMHLICGDPGKPDYNLPNLQQQTYEQLDKIKLELDVGNSNWN